MSFMVQLSQAEEPTLGADVPLSKTELRIVHSEGASCYDQDQIYKRCADQNQLFEIAKEQAKSMNKDVLLVYGLDSSCLSQALHNLLYFSSEAQTFQDAFVIRTIAKGSETGRQLIESLRSAHNMTGRPNQLWRSNFRWRHFPYLIRIDGQSGEPVDFIDTKPWMQHRYGLIWCGYNLKKVMERLF